MSTINIGGTEVPIINWVVIDLTAEGGFVMFDADVKDEAQAYADEFGLGQAFPVVDIIAKDPSLVVAGPS